MSELKKRISELARNFKRGNFASQDFYEYLRANIAPECLIADFDSIINDTARRVLKTLRDENGNRLFVSVPHQDEDGRLSNNWIQMRLTGLEEAEAAVAKVARIGESICRQANRLAATFQAQQNYQIPLPFPWLEDAETAEQ